MSDTPRTDKAAYEESCPSGWVVDRDLARELERELLVALKRGQDEWISVRDRLPVGGCQVLAVNSAGYYACVTRIFKNAGGSYDGEDATPEETSYPIGDITHWMPLPTIGTQSPPQPSASPDQP